MKKFTVAAALAALAISFPCAANVVYQFELLSPNDSLRSATGRLEITDAAAAAGRVDYRFCPLSGPCPHSDQNSPIISFTFGINNSYYSIAINPLTGTTNYLPLWDGGYFYANFDIINGAINNLNLSAINAESDVQFSGDRFRFASDNEGTGCFMGCISEGRFTLLETATVPEPGTLALIAVGASGLLLRRRSKKVRRQAL